MEARRKALREKSVGELVRLLNRRSSPSFFHNDLHDLESLWWIAIWKVLNCHLTSEASPESIDTKERTRQRELTKDLLFPQSNETLNRTLFLQTKVHFRDCLACVQFDTLKRTLDAARVALVGKYSKFESSFPDVKMQLFDGTHSLLRGLFRRCRECVHRARSREYQKPDPNSGRTRPEDAGCGILMSAPCRPLGRQSPINTCYHPLQGARGVNCVPKPAKRKRDSIDVGTYIRPVQRAR